MSWLQAPTNAALRKIVGRNLDGDGISGKNSNPVDPNFTTDMTDEFVVVVEPYPKQGIGQRFQNHPIQFKDVFRHTSVC